MHEYRTQTQIGNGKQQYVILHDQTYVELLNILVIDIVWGIINGASFDLSVVNNGYSWLMV